MAGMDSSQRFVDQVMLDDDLKSDIGDVVRMFEFSNAEPGGSCVARAVIAHAVLRHCGLASRLVSGGMLYRAGEHPRRDTLRFCLPNHLGGYMGKTFIGHVWNEIGDEIADFSCGDWEEEARQIHATETHPEDLALGPVVFTAPPPRFLWQPAHSLRAGWQRRGEPELGKSWYGGFFGRVEPDFAAYAPIVRNALPHIERNVALLGLRERVALQR